MEALMFKVDKNYMHPNIPRTIRFTDDIFAKLSEIAMKEEISFNALVLQCCNYAIEEYKASKEEEK